MAGAMAALALLALAGPSIAASPTVAGYNRLTVPGNSDAFVSLPFAAGVEGTFTVSGTPDQASGIAVAGAAFVADEYKDMYYIRVVTGQAAGRWATISGNTPTNLTLADNGFLGQLGDGDTFKILKHQTVGSVFPDKLEGKSFKASTSVAFRATEILVPNASAVGINKSAGDTYYYLNGAWRRFGSIPTQSFNDAVLSPDSYFIVRNGGDEELTVLLSGAANTAVLSQSIPVQSASNDVPASTGRPTPVTLKELGLGGTPAFETSTSVALRADELLVFENSASGINKSAAATYYYLNGAWRKFGSSPFESFDDEVLPAGAALLIRKAGGTVGTVTWVQPSPYSG
jgi:uncharacterized protein (TIGR02597 family)